MLKHVNNTLSRRPSKADTQYPPSPTPSTNSSCSSTQNSTSSFSFSPIPSCRVSTTVEDDNKSIASSNFTADSFASSNSDYYTPKPNRSFSLDESNGFLTRRRKQIRKSSLASDFGSAKTNDTERLLSNTSSVIDLIDNSIPLRVYANCLRPDIQYKTVGINHSTTCQDVIDSIFTKCKLAFKDPKLFYLAMEMRISGTNGSDIDATIPLEADTCPYHLLQCYPNEQAKFILQMTSNGSLIKLYDRTGVLGCDYKGVMISDKTTAGELLDILFRFSGLPSNSYFDVKDNGRQIENSDISIELYELHVEVDGEWSQRLETFDMIIPMQTITNQFGGQTKLVLKSQTQSHLETGDQLAVAVAQTKFTEKSKFTKRPQLQFQSKPQRRTHQLRTHRHLRDLQHRSVGGFPAAVSLFELNNRHSSLSSSNEDLGLDMKCDANWKRRSLHSLSSFSSSNISSGQNSEANQEDREPRTLRRSNCISQKRFRSHKVATDDEKILLTQFRRLGIGGFRNMDNVDGAKNCQSKEEFLV